MNIANRTFEIFGIEIKDKFFSGINRAKKILNNPLKTNEIDSSENAYKKEILDLIRITKRAWNSSILNFEQATENDIIDYYSYMIKAYQLRYNYLIKKAKELGIKEVL